MARTADDGGSRSDWVRQAMHPNANDPARYDANQMTHVETALPTVYIFHVEGEYDDRLGIGWLFGFSK